MTVSDLLPTIIDTYEKLAEVCQRNEMYEQAEKYRRVAFDVRRQHEAERLEAIAAEARTRQPLGVE